MTDKQTDADWKSLLHNPSDREVYSAGIEHYAVKIGVQEKTEAAAKYINVLRKKNVFMGYQIKELESIKAENERLREALEPFVNQYRHCDDSEIKKSSGAFSERILRARAALKQDEG